MSNTLLLQVYNKLLSHYGKQNWWPAETDYEMIAGAILTQNTNWKNVELALSNLKPFLNPKTIIEMDINILENIIKPAGFYKQKSIYLKNIFSFLNDHSLEYLRPLTQLVCEICYL